MATISRRTRHVVRRFLRNILRSNDSPRQIAGGAAIGMFVAFTPTVGFQMLIAACFATLFRCSRLPALVIVYVTNPFTALFIYGGCYAIGVSILKPLGFQTLSAKSIESFLVRPEDWSIWETFYRKLAEMFSLGWEGLAPLWIGSVIAGSCFGIITYQLTVRFVTGHRLLKAQRMARRAQRRLERIRRRQALEHETNAPHEQRTRKPDAPASHE